ncbi:MAG: RluA family pseudouridine synthase [Spirochaetales bacterium]|nr:RluA family pseudouridine synthase [Spirochaetales bacterium]
MAFEIQILYEDNHLIALNKLPGQLVQGDRSGETPLGELVKSYLKERYHKPGNVFLGIAHRLDRPASGIVLFARTSKALERLNRLFREGRVAKLYWALVDELPAKPSDTLVHHLRRNPEQNKSYAFDSPRVDTKEARLSYRVLLSLERYHLLEIDLHTGRHHQIRAQLARIGCHIKGDLKYGARRSNPGGGIHLHARRLSFPHPVGGEEITLLAPPPADPLWDAVMLALRGPS